MSEQPRKRVKVADTADDDEGGGAAAEVDAAVASAASPTDNLEKLVRSLKSYPLMDEVFKTAESNGVVFLSLPTGSGKTIGVSGSALLRGYKSYGAGGEVSYTTATPLKVMTTGHCINKLLDVIRKRGRAPELIVLDEIHHPSTENWVVLMLVKYILNRGVKMKVIIASATLNTDSVQALFDNAPLIHDAHKRAHPLDFEYQKAGTVEKSSYTDVLQLVPKAVQRAIDKTSGDVLVFLGLTAVVDTGYHKHIKASEDGQGTMLQTATITKANADQRAGRVGRMAAGIVYRLYTEVMYTAMDAHAENQFFMVPPF
eukprot:gene20391-10193_t